MEIRIKLFGVFRIDRFKEQSWNVPEGCRVEDVVEQLQLPPALLGIILVNGSHSAASCSLRDGDILSLLPVLDGG